MGKRTSGRKMAMQMLYQADIRHQPISDAIAEFSSGKLVGSDASIHWATELALGAFKVMNEADEVIRKYAIGWNLDRINPVDRSLLRLGYYELQYSDTPVNVVLNEVIEIAKQFSTEESPKFINGILGNFVKNECLRALSDR